MEKPPTFDIDLGKVIDRRVIEAAALTLVDTVLRLIEGDPHQFSTRGCQTCQAVSSIVARSFGCIRKTEEERERIRARAGEAQR